MKKNFKKVGLVLLLILLPLSIAAMVFSEIPEGWSKKDNIKIALVNEDEGSDFSGEPLLLGETFTNIMINDVGEYDFYVVSRGVAEKGLEKEDYDMMILFPKTFTKEAVALDSSDPEIANIYYKIAPTKSYLFQQNGEYAMTALKEDFENRLVKMYFMSVMKVLQNAQDNTGEIVVGEQLHSDKIEATTNINMNDLSNEIKLVDGNTGLLKNSIESVLISSNNQLDFSVNYLTKNQESNDFLGKSLKTQEQEVSSLNSNLQSFKDAQILAREQIENTLKITEEKILEKEQVLKTDFLNQKEILEAKKISIANFKDPITTLLETKEGTIKQSIKDDLDFYFDENKITLQNNLTENIRNKTTNSNILAYANSLVGTGPVSTRPTVEPVIGRKFFYIPPNSNQVTIGNSLIAEAQLMRGDGGVLNLSGGYTTFNPDSAGELVGIEVQSINLDYSPNLPIDIMYQIDVDGINTEEQGPINYLENLTGLTSGISLYLGKSPYEIFLLNTSDLSVLGESGSVYQFTQGSWQDSVLEDEAVDSIYNSLVIELADPSAEIEAFKTNYLNLLDSQISSIDSQISLLENIELARKELITDRENIMLRLIALEENSGLIIEEGELFYDKNFAMGGISFKIEESSADLLKESIALNISSEASVKQLELIEKEGQKSKIDTEALVLEGNTVLETMKKTSAEWQDKVNNHNEYAENFSGVFINTKIGSVDNNKVYDFLSHPVELANQGENEYLEQTIYPYFIMLTIMLCSFFTAFVLTKKKTGVFRTEALEEQSSRLGLSISKGGIIIGLGLGQGLLIGLASGFLVGLNSQMMLQWTSTIILFSAFFVISMYLLLKYLKELGYFISIIIFVSYLLINNFLAFNISDGGFLELLVKVFPLIQMENVLKVILFSMPIPIAGFLVVVSILTLALVVVSVILERITIKKDLEA